MCLQRYLVAICLFLCSSNSIYSQSDAPSDWKVLRVFVPSDQISKIATRDYDLVEIEDLARQLKIEAERRKDTLLESPKLNEAIYVARLEKGVLVSEQSRWVFSGNSLSQSYNLGEVSFALMRARAGGREIEQLVDHQMITTIGDIELNLTGEAIERWFGFSMLPTDTAQQVFNFRMPIAGSARMLIATANDIQLSSGDVVVEQIASPADYLPGDWPTAATFTFGGTVGRQWWLVHLSGIDRFQLSAATRDAKPNGFRHTLKSAELDYVASESSLDTIAKFTFAGSTSTGPMRLRLSSALRVSSILLNGSPVSWTVSATPEPSETFVELTKQADLIPRSIELRAASVYRDNRYLPEVALADSFTLRGRSRVFSVNGTVVNQLASNECEVVSSAVPTDAPTIDNLSKLHWTANWIGFTPKLELSASSLVQRWTARSLTRFAAQSDWLSAVCRIQMESDQVSSNELKLAVGEGWFVDKVKLIGPETSDMRAEFVERGTDQTPVTDVIVRWDKKRSNAFIDLEVVAHRPQQTNAETIRLFNQRLLTIPNADQIDNYVIEPSGRYRVQLSEDLLRFQMQPVDLPVWQQQLLPQLSDKWIFQGIRRSIPPVTLLEAKGTFSAQMLTLVDHADHDSGTSGNQSNGLDVEYIIRIQPLSGTIDSLTLSIPVELSGQTIDWVQLSEIGAAPEPVSTTGNAQGTPTIELALPESRVTPFILRGTSRVPGQSLHTNQVAIVGVPDATSGESTLIVPPRYSRFHGQSSVELLPATVCCNDDDLQQFLSRSTPSYLSSLVAARVDLKTEQTITLDQTPRPEELRGWIWNEKIEHRLDSGDVVSHLVQLDIETLDQTTLSLSLPENWNLDYATLNDELVRVSGQPSDLSRTIELPPRERSNVTLFCVSKSTNSYFASRPKLGRPQLNFPVYRSAASLQVPPSRLSLGSLPIMRDSGLLFDRLIPHAWWKWLSPALKDDTDANGARSAWTLLPVDNLQDDRPFWIVDRSAIATLALALTILSTALAWIIIGKSARANWLVIGCLVVAILLVPNELVGILQILLLSTILAGCIRLILIVIPGTVNRNGNTGGSRITPRSSITAGMIAVSMLFSGSVSGQGLPSYARTTGEPTPGKSAEAEVFGVLIPLDKDGEVSSSYAYVPTRLRRLLNNPAGFTKGTIDPRILSADYTLRLNSSSADRDEIQEFSAEYRVMIGRADSELRLPFLMSEMPQARAEVNGQSVTLSNTIVQQEPTAIVFRPKMPGTYLLKIYFDAAEVQEEPGHARLQVQIPLVPSSTMRVIADAATKIELQSIGRQQRTATELLAALGPTDELDCHWYTVRSVSNPSKSVDASSALWINSAGKNVVAAGRLLVENPTALPEIFHVVLDNSWEPIGELWGDAELVSSEAMALSNRRIYSLQFSRKVLENPRETASIRVLVAPSTNANVLPLPFLTIQEFELSSPRTLNWTSSGDAIWQPERMDAWTQLPAGNTTDWAELALSDDFKSFRVPSDSPVSSIQRQVKPELPSVEDSTEVHLSIAETRINYRASWPRLTTRRSALRIQIPKGARVDSALVDGLAWEHQMVGQGNDNFLLVFSQRSAPSLQTLELSLAIPARLGREAELPRVYLLDVTASASAYQVFTEAGLVCDFEIPESSSLLFNASETSPTALLSELETLVGRFELENEYRSTATLPAEFTLRRRAAMERVEGVMYIERAAQGWNARLEAQWGTDAAPLDFVFFDLPLSLRDVIDSGRLPRRFIPMGDSSRVTLCVVPAPPVDGLTTVTLRFPLSMATSGQSISVPRVQLLSAQPQSPVLALPKQIDGQTVQWFRGGRSLGNDWSDPLDARRAEAFDYFLGDKFPLQASWETIDRKERDAQLLCRQTTISEITEAAVVGHTDFWIHPKGQQALQINMTSRFSVVGVLIGDRTAIWNQAESGGLSVLMQPNYLPIRVRVLGRWTRDTKLNQMSIPLPSIENASATTVSVVHIDVPHWNVTQGVTAQSPNSVLGTLWCETLVSSLPAISGLAASEKESWLRGWIPESVGLDPAEKLPAQLASDLRFEPPNGESTNGEPLTVTAYWSRVCSQLGISTEAPPLSSPTLIQSTPDELSFPNANNSVCVDAGDLELSLEKQVRTASMAPKLIAAALLASIFILTLRLASRLNNRYFRLLSAHPWVYWLQLAILAWLFIPAIWPSLVLVVASAGMAVSQLVDYRRTTQFR